MHYAKMLGLALILGICGNSYTAALGEQQDPLTQAINELIVRECTESIEEMDIVSITTLISSLKEYVYNRVVTILSDGTGSVDNNMVAAIAMSTFIITAITLYKKGYFGQIRRLRDFHW